MSVDLSSGAPTRQRRHARFQPRQEARLDAFGDQQPRARAADLTLVEEDAVDDAFDGAVEIGVVEHDERRFAAKLQR